MVFKNIKVVDFYNRNNRYNCDNEEGYMEHLKKTPNMAEIIGEFKQQIKPVFDVDAYDKDINIDEVKKDINSIFPEKTVNFAKRDVRITDKGKKYSYRFYVDGVRIQSKNLKELIIKNGLDKNPIYDTSIYQKNHTLHLPFTTAKNSGSVPSLNPIDCSIFECCASYIKEEYEDWDLKFPKKEPELIIKKDDDKDDDNDEYNDVDKQKYIFKICSQFDKSRLDIYENWINVMFAIINICKKAKISQKNYRDLLHKVSAISKFYDEDKVEKWLNNFIDKERDDGYGFNYLINTCIKEDNIELWESEYNKPSYNQVKKKFETHCFKCINNIIYIDLNLNRNDVDPEIFFILKSKEVIEKYMHLVYYDKILDKKNETWTIKPQNFITKWIKDDKIKLYQSVCFSPEGLTTEMSKKHYNLFKGYKASYLPISRNYDIIQPYLKHIKEVLFNDDEYSYNWFIQYLANLIQHPNKKSSVIIIFQGEQGAGKSFVVDTFAEKIIGNDYAIATSNPERVFFGTFNSLLCNKVLSVINEAGKELRTCMDRIKDLSVINNINIEKKGKDPITFTNYNNFIGTTNNANPFDIDWDDRRFAWFNVSSKYVGNEEYFNNLIDICNTDEFASALYHYLLEEIDITIKNFQKTRPITKEYNKIKIRNLPNVIKFLTSGDLVLTYRKARGKDEYIDCITQKNIYEKYKMFCEKFKYTPYNLDGFNAQLLKKDNGISEVINRGVRGSFRFNKDVYEKWLSKFENDCIEFNDEFDEEDEFEDE